eukprot:1148646-Pelagomonas_calceolata.AAC.1
MLMGIWEVTESSWLQNLTRTGDCCLLSWLPDVVDVDVVDPHAGKVQSLVPLAKGLTATTKWTVQKTPRFQDSSPHDPPGQVLEPGASSNPPIPHLPCLFLDLWWRGLTAPPSSASRLRDFMNQADVLGLVKHVLFQLSCPRRQTYLNQTCYF